MVIEYAFIIKLNVVLLK